MKITVAILTIVLSAILTAIPNPFGLQQEPQVRDPREGRIINPDSSEFRVYAQNHAKTRCGKYFFREREGLRFVLNRQDSARRRNGGEKRDVERLALAKSFAAQSVQESTPSAIEVSSWTFEILVPEGDTTSMSCLKKPPP